jgi:hypothetical protein
VTTHEKPDSTAEPERTTVITSDQAPKAGAGDAPGPGSDTTVETAKPDPAAPATPAGDDAGTAGGSNHTPPPWARVSTDEDDALGGLGGDATQTLPRPGLTPAPAAASAASTPAGGAYQSSGTNLDDYPAGDEATINVPRPVVSGTAAGRLFGTQTGVTPVEEDQRYSAPGPSTTPPSALRRPGRGPRRANLQVKRFDPWSVLKLSLVLGVALFFVWLVAVGVLYAVLDGMGVWDKVNGISGELLNGSDGTTGEPLISAGRVFGIAAIIGAINIVLFSALATVGAFVYNVSADLAGGLEVTLAERE